MSELIVMILAMSPRTAATRSSPPNEKLKLELDYAWNWFQDSASQRLTTFNFFLVIVGLLLVAYAQAVSHDWCVFGITIGVIGAIVALGFLILDVRNEVLVNRGRCALTMLEKNLHIELAPGRYETEELAYVLEGWFIGNWAAAWARRKNGKGTRQFRY